MSQRWSFSITFVVIVILPVSFYEQQCIPRHDSAEVRNDPLH